MSKSLFGKFPYPPSSSVVAMQGSLKCLYCDKTFIQSKQLDSHMKSHVKNSIFVCIYPGCGKRFRSMDKLLRHRNEHSGSLLEETEAICDGGESSKAITDALQSFSLPTFFHSRTLPIPSPIEKKSDVVEDLAKAQVKYEECPKPLTKL